tara:strand:- start:113 stop:238 length:126 start_codon:yes stop_codon:yes gene_type:complete
MRKVRSAFMSARKLSVATRSYFMIMVISTVVARALGEVRGR